MSKNVQADRKIAKTKPGPAAKQQQQGKAKPAPATVATTGPKGPAVQGPGKQTKPSGVGTFHFPKFPPLLQVSGAKRLTAEGESKSDIVLPVVTTTEGVTLNGPTIGTNVPGPQAAKSVAEDTADHIASYAFGVLQPYVSLCNGSYPKYPDGNMGATATWGSMHMVTAPNIATFFTGTDGSVVVADPFGCTTVYTASDGTSFTAATRYNDPSLSAAAGDFSLIRCVAMQLMVRNPVRIIDQAGVVAQGCAPVSVVSPTEEKVGTIVMPTLATMNSLRANTQTFTRSGNNPGDIGVPVWVPSSIAGELQVVDEAGQDYWVQTIGCLDNTWIDPNLLTNTNNNMLLCGSAKNTTAVFSMAITPDAVVSNQDVVVVRLWEGIPLRTVAPIVQPTISMGELDAAKRAVMVALRALPRMAIARNVWRDDGIAESIVSDVKSIAGTAARLFKSAKDIGSSIWNGITSLFGESRHRLLAAMTTPETMSWASGLEQKDRDAYDRVLQTLFGTIKKPKGVQWIVPSTKEAAAIAQGCQVKCTAAAKPALDWTYVKSASELSVKR